MNWIFEGDSAWILPLSAAMAVVGSFSAPPMAHGADFRPGWADQSAVTDVPNSSFLYDTGYKDTDNFLNELVDRKDALEMRQQIDDMNRDYELKRAYGLAGPVSTYYHDNEVSGYGQSIVNNVTRYQGIKSATKVQQASERDPTIKPAFMLGAATAVVSTGHPMSVDVDKDTRLTAATNVRRQTGEVRLNSSLLNAGIFIDMSKPEARDPSAPPLVDPTQADERYKLSLSRDLPLFNLSSSVSYGSTSNTLTAALRTPLTEHLSAEVNSIRPAPMNRGVTTVGQDAVKFNYGINF